MRGWEQVTTATVPDHILRMLTEDQRAEFGKAGRLKEEVLAQATAKAEKELQEQVRQLLQEHRGIVVIYSRMDRKPTTPVGTPDFIFAVHGRFEYGGNRETFACAWELKLPREEQSEDQIAMQKKMETPPNAWTYRIVRSVAQARLELAEMGISPR